MGKSNGARRVALVAGLRTPFAKQGSVYAGLSALDLGKAVVSELLARTGVDARRVEQVVYGQVIPSLSTPNIAREIVLGTGLPRDIEAFSVARACATGYQSTVSVAEAILAGTISCAVAGGADSASDVPVAASRTLATALVEASRATTLGDRVKALSHLRAQDLVPVTPSLRDSATGLTMGESAEKMAKENGISRHAQDEYAHRSHTLASQAWDDGRLAQEVMHVFVPPSYEVVTEDNLIRRDSRLESYKKLTPAFDDKYGSVTAGNSSPLTDGASALLLMSEDRARAEGFDVLGFIRSYAFAALDPSDQMLMGPAYATPLALDRAKVALEDLDLIDMHEAFSAQVLSNVQAFESAQFARDKLGRKKRIGRVDWNKFNVTGGSIAIGHPFAATGARQITQTLRELRRRGGELALCTACAAGGLGAALVLETGS
jgi:acetyl-CoA acyltransferase